LRRLVHRPVTVTPAVAFMPAVASVTAGKPVIPAVEPPRPYDFWAQGEHLPMPELDERPKPQPPRKKHARHSPPKNETIEGSFVLGRRRPSS